MAKWNCPCGYPMHDHNAPDENFYRVFSDVEWNAIETDDNGNLNFCKDIDKSRKMPCTFRKINGKSWKLNVNYL